MTSQPIEEAPTVAETHTSVPPLPPAEILPWPPWDTLPAFNLGLLADTRQLASPRCRHTARDNLSSRWPRQPENAFGITERNVLPATGLSNVADFAECMDATLFRFDKRGWDPQTPLHVGCWNFMVDNRHHFTWTIMKTNGGYRAVEACCIYCHQLCNITWQSHATDYIASRAPVRARRLSFWGCESQAAGGKKTI